MTLGFGRIVDSVIPLLLGAGSYIQSSFSFSFVRRRRLSNFSANNARWLPSEHRRWSASSKICPMRASDWLLWFNKLPLGLLAAALFMAPAALALRIMAIIMLEETAAAWFEPDGGVAYWLWSLLLRRDMMIDCSQCTGYNGGPDVIQARYHW